MKVILKQDVEKLGKAGDVVKVAPGYGRNYLIPQKLAFEATPGNMKIMEIEKAGPGAARSARKEAATLLAQGNREADRHHPAQAAKAEPSTVP